MEHLLISIAFLTIVILYFLYVHKKLVRKLESKIKHIADDISVSEAKIQEYQNKIDELSELLVASENKFKLTCDEIEIEIEKVKNTKIQALENEFLQKQKNIESEVASALELHQIQIKNKIIETAYLLAAEYFKQKTDYSEDSKKKIIDKLLKNIKFE